MKKLRSSSKVTDPTIWIGKGGASEHLIQQVENQLRSRELVKLKLQKTAHKNSETLVVAEKIAASTGSTLVDVIGHTFTLYRKRKLTKPMRDRSNQESTGVLR
ncbi:MAG TPA: YhbY family RNA-binding protein [Candidatus Bathyarchaeia archaeon]|nr:YhbY family RNA-binding protein [Candidatus Bathyarchaeia archaeon]